MHDTHFGSRYEHVLGALLSVGGKGLREELSKQMKLVQLLGGVAEKVRQASGSTRQVCSHRREYKDSFGRGVGGWHLSTYPGRLSPVSFCLSLHSAGRYLSTHLGNFFFVFFKMFLLIIWKFQIMYPDPIHFPVALGPLQLL